MANIVKIYELKTIGYNEIITQLKNIEVSFQNIKNLKKQLNDMKFSNEDAARIQEVNKQLNEQKIRSAELRAEKLRLKNEELALNNARVAGANATKNNIQANQAESGSLTDLIRKQKELAAAIKATSPNSNRVINFDGQQLSRAQAIEQYRQINGQVQNLTKNMTGMQSIGDRVNTSLANGFASMRGQLSQMIVMYTGWFAAFREAGEIIRSNIKLSDSFADMQIRIKGTKEDVETLFEALKKIDTRTSLANLVDIANVVAKKGVPKEEIAAITAEFDKLNVVLGKELGDPASATASIIKLITIFNDDKHVTADRIKEIGTELFKLTTTGVATGDFLVGFAERVGAVRGITGLTLPSILGMGAALQQLGQHEEVAGTAAVQLTTRLFENIPKFAKAAQMSVEEFRKTITDDPFQALIAVAEGLKNLPTDALANEFEEVVSAFGEIGVRGVRVKAVLGDIATNGEFVKQRMKDAAVSMEDLGRQSDAVALKQSTFAAQLERVRKEIELIGTSKTMQIVLSAIGTAILFLVSNLGIIIGVIASYAAIWLVANSAMVAARLQTIALNIAFTAQYAVLVVVNTFTRAYTAALLLFTGAAGRAATATTLWGTALKLLPIGLLITLLAILAAGCQTVKAKIEGATAALREQALAMQIDAEITQRASTQIADQVAKIEIFARVVDNAKVSIDTKRLALEELIKINAKFSNMLDGNIVDLEKFKVALAEVKEQIEINARAEAASALTGEKYKEYLTIVKTRQQFETAYAQNREVRTNQLSQEQRDLLKQNEAKLPADALDVDLFFNRKGFNVTDKNIDKFKSFFKALEDDAFNTYQAYLKSSSDLQVKIADKATKDKANQDKTNSKTLADIIANAANEKFTSVELANLIKRINDEIDTLKEGDPKIEELLAARKKFQARLDALKGKETKEKAFTGSKLTGEDKDALAEIQKSLDLQLAEEDKRFTELQLKHRATAEEEQKHVENVRDINLRFISLKIGYLESIGALNVKEKAQLATFYKERAQIQLDAIEEIQRINDREFQLQQRNLKRRLDNQVQDIETKVAEVQSDKSLDETTRAQARLDADRAILKLQENYNKNVDILEKKLNQKTKENAEEGANTRRAIIEDTIKIFNARVNDAANAADQIAAQYRVKAAEAAIKVLQGGGSPTEIARELEKIQKDLTRQLLANQVAQLAIEVDLYKQGKESKIKTEKELQEALAKLREKELELLKDNIEKQITVYERFIRAIKEFGTTFKTNVLGLKQYSDDAAGKAQAMSDAVLESQKTISQAITAAYQGYFQLEEQRIDRETEAHQDRLDRQEEEAEAQAQSEQEKESIHKQFEARRKALEKSAAEEKRQLALKQLAIDYAVSIVKSIAQYGFPLALIPIAAATALYFIQRGIIQSQKFERGGILNEGGQLKGRRHSQGGIKFNYEAEDQELMIINRRSANNNAVYSVTGTPKQIASKINELGGGVSFSPGASFYKKFADGGLLGTAFTAPVYRPSNTLNNDTEALRADFLIYAKAMADRIDRIEVVQVTRTVTDAQRRQVKQDSIGTL